MCMKHTFAVMLRSFCFLLLSGTSFLQAQSQETEAGYSPAELRIALEKCRAENERLRKLLPDSLAYPKQPGKRPLAMKINNITYRSDGKQYSLYQVITDTDPTRLREKVVHFLQDRGHVPQGDTLQVTDLMLTELHPTRIHTRWLIENHEASLSVLKVWILLPGGSYLNPENYPGYHEKISRLLTYIINDQR
jgi:hypothetical protein